jgi:hypothetical protein
MKLKEKMRAELEREKEGTSTLKPIDLPSLSSPSLKLNLVGVAST